MEDGPFYDEDSPIIPPPKWDCPNCCKHEGHLSYHLCDVEPYPFEGVLKECHACGHMWDDKG